MLVLNRTADISFIYLGRIPQHYGRFRFQHFADTVQNKPCSFLSDAQLAVNLQYYCMHLNPIWSVGTGYQTSQDAFNAYVEKYSLNP